MTERGTRNTEKARKKEAQRSLEAAAHAVGDKYRNNLLRYLSGDRIHDEPIQMVPTSDWDTLADRFPSCGPALWELVCVISDAEHDRDTQAIPEAELYRRLFFTRVGCSAQYLGRDDNSTTQYLLADILRYRVRQATREGLRVTVPPEASALLTEAGVKRGLLNDGFFSTVYVSPYEEVIMAVITGTIKLTPASRSKSTKLTYPESLGLVQE